MTAYIHCSIRLLVAAICTSVRLACAEENTALTKTHVQILHCINFLNGKHCHFSPLWDKRKNFLGCRNSESLAPSEKQRCRKTIFGCRTTASRGPCSISTLKCILRELSLNIAQLSTARQELLWLHFPLGATLAFFDFCAPWSPEEAFCQRPGAAPLASVFR